MQKAPMTIFYGGQVIKFDGFPEDKAKELMEMAQSMTTPPADDPQQPAAGADGQDPTIARKLTLQRFFIKRKQRSGTGDASHHRDLALSSEIHCLYILVL